MWSTVSKAALRSRHTERHAFKVSLDEKLLPALRQEQFQWSSLHGNIHVTAQSKDFLLVGLQSSYGVGRWMNE